MKRKKKKREEISTENPFAKGSSGDGRRISEEEDTIAEEEEEGKFSMFCIIDASFDALAKVSFALTCTFFSFFANEIAVFCKMFNLRLEL